MRLNLVLLLVSVLHYTGFCLGVSLDGSLEHALLPDSLLQLPEVVNQACAAADFDHANVTFIPSDDELLKLVELQVPDRNCTLRRFDDDRDAVLSVLKGKHLVLIGDSLTRYQYLSLVYFLESGNWSSDYPNQMWEKDFKSWNHFYQVGATLLIGNLRNAYTLYRCMCMHNSA
jgi:GDSL/SGNH-like Acyl-Esterase family found in Pmr5 and Cas1p